MHPVILQTPYFTVYSYGLMLSLTFLVGALLLNLELVRRRMNPDLLGPTIILAVVFGLFGAKLFDAFEYWDRFLQDPVRVLLKGSGLTFLGGFVLATLAIVTYLWFMRVPVLRFCDAVAPGLMVGYGVARVGCLLSGDGDYGIPTQASWAMTYPNGTVSTLAAKNASLVEQWKTLFPGEAVPVDIPVHPAPIYEFIAAFILGAILWRLRLRPRPMGWLFFVYLMMSGMSRFLVEFIRLNPDWFLGLSQSQLISLGLVGLGGVGLVRIRGAQPDPGGDFVARQTDSGAEGGSRQQPGLKK